MKVLIADDSSAIRGFLKRLLERDFGCEVTEAESGLDALDALDGTHFSLFFLDFHMPVMNGIETLEMLRTSSYGSLPVIMLTSERDSKIFKAAIKLGVRDYLLKSSLRPETAKERLSQLMSSFDASGSVADKSDKTPEPPSGLTVLVAEGDPDHRHFLMNYFRPRGKVLEAATGAQALKLCLTDSPQVVMVGERLGVVDGVALARKVRSTEALKQTRLIASVPTDHVAAARKLGVYDDVIARSFVPAVFESQIERVIGSQERAATIPEDILPRFRPSLITSIQQVFGMMLGAEVETRAASEDLEDHADTLAAGINLTIADHEVTLDLELRIGADVARALAGQMTEQSPEELSDMDRDSGLGEIVNMVAGRLQHRLFEHGVTTQIGLPTTGPASAAMTNGTGDDDPVSVGFRLTEGHSEFSLSACLTPAPSG